MRGFIGLVALFVAVWAATNMGMQAGGILQQTSNMEVPDGRIYGFFGIIVVLMLITEVATQIAHKQIQIPAIILNRTLGVVFGLLTAVLFSVVVVYPLVPVVHPIRCVRVRPAEHGRCHFVLHLT